MGDFNPMAHWPVDPIRAAIAPGRPGFSVEVVAEIDSTNSELMRRARAGQCAPTLLVAETQSAGRGRVARAWQSQAGRSLTFSIGITLAPRDWSGLSLAVGVALADALDPDRERGIALKWPNDLWWQERKLAGILVETVTVPGADAGRRHAVIGIGINIGKPPPGALSTPPAWLREIEPGIDAAQILGRIAAPLLAALDTFETIGFAPFHARFDARDALRGRPVTAAGGNDEPLVGTALGVAENGALLVHSAAGMQALSGSEVSVRPAHVETGS